uniref:Putative secreted protein n=1 Tax=Amblyomma parvum TaxID=251391 RepID=A0A023G2D2_AMBPA
MLWLLLLPLLMVAAAVIALFVLWARRQAWGPRNKPFSLGSPPPVVSKPRLDPGPPVVKVVYSRDSEAHMAVVSQLCSLLQSELGMRVEWDEAAAGPAHVTHDWAMALAQLPCPAFNPAAVQAGAGVHPR